MSSSEESTPDSLSRSASTSATVMAVDSSGKTPEEPIDELLRPPGLQGVVSLFRAFIAAAGNGLGANGIARVLQQHTKKAVIVQDAVGHVIATGDVDSRPGTGNSDWPSRPLPDNARHAVAIPNGDRWVAIACPHGEILGAISLLDSGELPTRAEDILQLEQAATVLGWELLHNRKVAEAKLALWDDFATELFEDSDVGRVRSHAHRLGYDLDRTHRAVLVMAPGPVSAELKVAVRRATERLGVKCLLTIRSNGVVLVVADELDWAELARVIETEAACKVRLGVGGPHRLEDLRRSLADAEFSLRLSSVTDKPITLFDELGVWRILARQDVSDLQELVDSWIGKLIVYDREHHSELLKTLFAYLNEAGALEATAAKLYVHRNTLKYRLTRVGELTGWDLDDPEQRFHLNLACRAYEVWQALETSEAANSSARDEDGVNGAPTTTLNQLTRPLLSSPGSSARGHARSTTKRPSPA